MSGSNAPSKPGSYGVLGVMSDSTFPGIRTGAASWTSSQDTLWLFGGKGLDSVSNYGRVKY